MRIGVFGGSFDPVHYGHLVLAEQCREQVSLDRVLFVPAGMPPHKAGMRLSEPKHRTEMLRLAIAGYPEFEVSTIELERPGPSYTVDTLERLVGDNPGDEFFLLMGPDMFLDFPTWRAPRRILELACLVVAYYPEAPVQVPDVGLDFTTKLKERVLEVRMPTVALRATDIRARVRTGRSIRFLVPAAVECYIHEQGLYRDRWEGGTGSEEG